MNKQMTIKRKCYVNTAIKNTVDNQRKQNKHLRINEDLQRLFGHIGSV